MALACSFWQHTSASNLYWDVLNDSDFKVWVKYFGRSRYIYLFLYQTMIFSGNIINWWIFKNVTCKIYMTRQDSHICLTTWSWRQIYTRLYQEHSIDNTSIYISGRICDYSHLELTEKGWFASRYFKSINMGKSQRNRCKGIGKHPFSDLNLTICR